MSSPTLAATPAAAMPSRGRVALGLAVAMLVVAATSLLPRVDPVAAGIVPTVQMGTAANYSVLAATTVTNTNMSVLSGSVGLSPGSSVVGFPPAIVLPPATIEAASAATLQAQVDLTTAYLDAAGRGVEFTQTNPDLVGQLLVPGVYAASAKAPLELSGQLVLDGQGDPTAVFVFQTDSTLITSSASAIALINGASECNVFWQVGSSATLGSGSLFVGNILALTSITVASSAVVHGARPQRSRHAGQQRVRATELRAQHGNGCADDDNRGCTDNDDGGEHDNCELGRRRLEQCCGHHREHPVDP